MQHTWELSSKVSTSDVKELIPEMFYLPEALLNANHYPFGCKQNGDVVDDVILPPWAKGSARRFVTMHRAALESKYVSENLSHWIDLIFGSKQTGEAAAAANNLFLPASYESALDINAIEDEVVREAQWAIVRSFGQTPRKLLSRPHMPRDTWELRRPLWHRRGNRPKLLWSVSTREAVHSFHIRGQYVHGVGANKVVLATQGVFVLWGAWDGALRVCALDSGKELCHILELHDDCPVCAAPAPKRGLVVVGGDTGLLSVYRLVITKADSKTITELHSAARLLGHARRVSAVAVSDAYSLIVSGSDDGNVWAHCVRVAGI